MPAEATLPVRADSRTGTRRNAPDTAAIVATLELLKAQLGELHRDALRSIGKRRVDPTEGELYHAGKLSGALLLSQSHVTSAIAHATRLGGGQ